MRESVGLDTSLANSSTSMTWRNTRARRCSDAASIGSRRLFSMCLKSDRRFIEQTNHAYVTCSLFTLNHCIGLRRIPPCNGDILWLFLCLEGLFVSPCGERAY